MIYKGSSRTARTVPQRNPVLIAPTHGPAHSVVFWPGFSGTLGVKVTDSSGAVEFVVLKMKPGNNLINNAQLAKLKGSTSHLPGAS